MYSRTALALKYLNYYFKSSNGQGHGIHSPFVFEFVQKLLNDKSEYEAYQSIERLRKRLSSNQEIIAQEDYGATSAFNRSRTIGAITKAAAKSPKYGQLLYRFVKHYAPANILELGTSVGISSAYLASGNPNATVHTIEGNKALAEQATKNLASLNLTNVKVHPGKFSDVLPRILANNFNIDLAFIDGNHRKEPTLDYFNLMRSKLSPVSAVIFDDIHWSEEMESAWQCIKESEDVLLTIDLFFMGIVFFRPGFKAKQHFAIRF